ncbi:ferric siderophore ABC transporter substrate-binding protein [Riemerella columbina]|uniref:ferric siderophore ABC transporter substrate-binding protein n=1 Tax=Riemerella columbina TaxID=103810 RepID=UPI000475E325|nr:ferric siderophore ABC transporter substrate-binding protein [Riemerella columbina]
MYSTESISNSERNDRIKSAVLTFLISLLVLLLIYFYTFTRETPRQEVVTTMLINFGDNENGNGTEEPQQQEGSPAIEQNIETENQTITEATVQPKQEPTITGTNTKISTPKAEKIEKKTSSQSTTKPKATPKKQNTSKKAETSKKQGDDRGNAAIGNLIKGRGTKAGGQGDQGNRGNAGDPLGGSGNGDSKIGIDRKLISFIPGTMGRGGQQPAHNCTASGSISIDYTVDKAGNVVSARRSGGIADPCVVQTTIAWVKQYVKAERASTSSKGIYKIVF